MLFRSVLLFLFMLVPAGVLQAENEALLNGDDQTLRTRAQDLYQQVENLQAKAEKIFASEDDACWDRFFVNACKDKAKQGRRERLYKARKMEHKVRIIERELRRRKYAKRKAQKQLQQQESQQQQ